MNTCKTCKWWKRDEPELHPYRIGNEVKELTWLDVVESKDYEWAKQFYKEHEDAPFGRCTHPKFVYSQIPHAIDGVSYEDAEGYRASLLTGQDFGCIHHEPKE